MAKKKIQIIEDIEENEDMIQSSIDDDYTTESDIDELELELSTTIDDELLEDVYEEDEFSLRIKSRQNKHKQEGKHSLKFDTIFHGKIAPNADPYDIEMESYIMEEHIEQPIIYDSATRNKDDLYGNERSVNKVNLYNDIRNTLEEVFEFDFTAPRRKPNKQTFNNYYKTIVKELGDKRYTRVEIFVELAYYFTDNIFNMYKLLEPKYSTAILRELKDSGFIEEASTINFF